MNKIKTLSIIIPVYNEEKYLDTILSKVIEANSQGLSKEIVIIDDGSNDTSKAKINKLKVQIKSKKFKFIFINKSQNAGKGSALKDGFLKSSGDIVLIQDADLEYDPDNYQKLIEPFLKYGADVVYGSRFVSHHPHRVLYYWHFLGNLCLTVLSNLMTNLNLTDMETGYKAFNGKLIRKIAPRLQSSRFGFEPEVTARIAKIKDLKIYEVGISYFGRTYADGKKIGWKDGVRAIFEIIKYKFVD